MFQLRKILFRNCEFENYQKWKVSNLKRSSIEKYRIISITFDTSETKWLFSEVLPGILNELIIL